MLNQLYEYGIVNLWTYENVAKLTIVFEHLQQEVIPTKYWFDLSKYDFMQELINETQTKVEEFVTATKQLEKSWSREVLEAEGVSALDYYMERKESGLKLFDFYYHRSKKILKDFFIDSQKTFNDSEVDELHKNLYTIKRNEYWLSKNKSRIRQFWGSGYEETQTDFTLLRTQYEIAYKLSNEYTTDNTRSEFITSMLESERYENMIKLLTQVEEKLKRLPYEQLLHILPGDASVLNQIDLFTMETAISSFLTIVRNLENDYELLLKHAKGTVKAETFGLEELRKAIYTIERIAHKKAWLKKYHLKIKEVFRYEQINLDTDWNALKEKLFNTDLKEFFHSFHEINQKEELSFYQESMDWKGILHAFLDDMAPVHEDYLLKNMTTLLELSRMTPKMKQSIMEYIVNDLSKEYEIRDAFIYKKGEAQISMRIPKETKKKREVETIAPLELKAGIITLIKVNYEMTLDEIQKMMAYLLEYPRRTKKYNDIVEQMVRELQREEMICRYSGGFRVEEVDLTEK